MTSTGAKISGAQPNGGFGTQRTGRSPSPTPCAYCSHKTATNWALIPGGDQHQRQRPALPAGALRGGIGLLWQHHRLVFGAHHDERSEKHRHPFQHVDIRQPARAASLRPTAPRLVAERLCLRQPPPNRAGRPGSWGHPATHARPAPVRAMARNSARHGKHRNGHGPERAAAAPRCRATHAPGRCTSSSHNPHSDAGSLDRAACDEVWSVGR